MTMSEPASNGGDPSSDLEWTLWPVGSPASRSAQRVVNLRKRISAGYGRPCATSSTLSDRPGSSPRTCPVCSGWDSPTLSVICEQMDTEFAPERSQLAQWAHHTHVSGCSLLPTPLASDGARGGLGKEALERRLANPRHGIRLNEAVGGPPNPEWYEWLTGFPAGWTDVGLSATP